MILSSCGKPSHKKLVPSVSREKAMAPTPVLLPGRSHGRRRVVDYSPWGHKELDTTA